jgi:hypothetical protein
LTEATHHGINFSIVLLFVFPIYEQGRPARFTTGSFSNSGARSDEASCCRIRADLRGLPPMQKAATFNLQQLKEELEKKMLHASQ